MSEKIICSLSKIRKVYPGKKEVLKDISLSFFYGAKIGVIGANGSGKSTLLKIMAGIEKEFFGEAVFDPKMNIGYLPQEPVLEMEKTVTENIKDAMGGALGLIKRFEELSGKMGEELPEDEMQKVMDEFGEIQEQIDQSDGWEVERKLEIAMDALRVPDGESIVKNLSGGERRRVALCKLLLESPDILILDEPTNHLDAESVEWLEIYLKKFPGTVVAVTHDRYFLDHAAGWILELDRGEGIPFKGNYSAWLEAKEERLRVEQKSESKRQKTLKQELDWMRQGAKARQSKSKARVLSYESLLSQEAKKRVENCEIAIPIPERLGDKVIEVNGVSKGFGERLLIDDFSMIIPPGAIVGIIGANGSGKTTLLKMITEKEKPDAGSISIGDSVKFASVDQMRDELDDSKTVWQEISGGLDEMQVGSKVIPSRAYVGSFGFKGGDQQTHVGKLSGGERGRVHLAKLLKSGGNVLLLDEPTNDLDVGTLSALEEALLNFCGCILVVSHDRFFLDRVSTHTIAFEGDSKVVFHPGPYSDYEEYKHKQTGEKEIAPKRIKFKSLTR